MDMRQSPGAGVPDAQGSTNEALPVDASESASAPAPVPGHADMPARELRVTELTDVGRVRSHNEDYVGHFTPRDLEMRRRKGILCIVADGMGGHQAGEVASKEAVGLVIDQYYRDMNPDVGKSLVKAIQAANRSVFEQAQADAAKAGMGTTLVAAVILDQKVYVANVGDSRAYIIGPSGTSQITEDHSLVEEQVRAGLLTPEQARRHPQRNLVTRALGTRPSVEVDLFEGTMGEEDVLLLCSDGLTNHVQDHDLEMAVAEHPPEKAAWELVELAKERGGSDNITVLIVTADGESTETAPVAAAPRVQGALILVLGFLAALLAVAIIALLVIRPLVLGGSGTESPTPTATLPQAQPSATLAGTTVATTLEAATPTPALVATQTFPPEATELQTPTAGASSGTGSGSPTATLRPTEEETATSSPTTTPTASATSTAPPVTRTATQLPPPSLLQPEEDDAGSLQGQVRFEWFYSPGLASGQAFQVLIWPISTTDALGAASRTTNTQQLIDLDVVLSQRGGEGDYYWTVVLVEDSIQEARLSATAEPWVLHYQGKQDPRLKPSDPQPVVPTVAQPTAPAGTPEPPPTLPPPDAAPRTATPEP